MTSQNRRPTMNAKQAKYPQLRFKGFTDPWEKRTLGQTTTKAKSYSVSRDVERDHETGYRYIHYGDIHTGVADIVTEHTKLPNIEPANYDELRVNDLVVADASEDYQGIAEPAVVVGLPTQHLVAGLHTIALRPSSASSLYLYYLLHTESFKHFGYQTGTGLKVFGISWSNLSKFTFMIPSRPEQEKIVKLIESVDNLTSDNQRKLAKLKELKQGYLQKLFPKNGSKFPQLRFTGFADAWEERKLGDVAPLRGGFAFKSSEFRNTGVPIVRISNILSSGEVGGAFAYYDEQDKDDKYILPDKSAVLAMSGATTGKVSILSQTSHDKVYQNQRVGYFQSVDCIDYDFISTIVRSELFMMQLESVLVSGAQPNVSSKEIDSFDFMIPKLVQEQQKIGSFFKQLDDTITLHQRKLEKLQELKKGYLQKMFC